MALPQDVIDGLKSAIGVLRNVCQSVDEQGLVRSFDSSSFMVETYNSDLIKFMLYLTASDGGVADAEAAMISELLDTKIEAAQCVDIIQQAGIYSTEFESTVPVSFQMITLVGRDIFGQDLGQGLYNLYQGIGQAIVLSDDAVHPQEAEDLNIYLNTLQSYLDAR